MRTVLGSTLALAVTAMLLSACGPGDVAQPCAPGMPSARELQSDPAFASLTYHKNTVYEIRRGVGYDLWGDARFEYRAALEYELVPMKGGRSDDDVCAQAISLRFVEPVDSSTAVPMIGALARRVAAHTPLDAAEVRAEAVALLASGEKYRLLSTRGPISIYAGRVAHPVRGEIFVLTFSWRH